MFSRKTLLITGGTGSFGNAVLKRFLKTDVKEIRIFSRDEKKQDDMRKQYASSKLKFYLGDVRDSESVKAVVHGVDYIFHAAALKQVPNCEFFPIEAVKTNILGTENVLNAAVLSGVKKMVCLSTDKAAYPINAMGMSKALMEKLVIAKGRANSSSGTTITCTRYGNVMYSRGSVIPLFVDQIKSGREMTITNPNMTRFLMSLDEAVDLVLFAFSNAQPGDLFIQKAPASTIEDLAKAVAKIFGIEPLIKIIGTRHGEKLYETLLTTEEKAKAIDLGNYFRIPVDDRDLNYDKYFNEGCEDLNIDSYNSDNTERLTVDQVASKLLAIEEIQQELEGWNSR